MTLSMRRFAGICALLAATACGHADATDNTALDRDLEQTRVSEFELANQNAKRTDVTSATERIPTARRSPSPRAPASRAPASPESGASQSSVPVGIASAAKVPTDTSATAPRPRPPTQTQERRGPYKTVDEIIRNAPFPIKP